MGDEMMECRIFKEYAIVRVTKDDVMYITGGLQVCTDQQAGCETVKHIMNSLFSDSDNDAVLLIDASNAFNQLSQTAALLNITRLCPSVAPVCNSKHLSFPSRALCRWGSHLFGRRNSTG